MDKGDSLSLFKDIISEHGQDKRLEHTQNGSESIEVCFDDHTLKAVKSEHIHVNELLSNVSLLNIDTPSNKPTLVVEGINERNRDSVKNNSGHNELSSSQLLNKENLETNEANKDSSGGGRTEADSKDEGRPTEHVVRDRETLLSISAMYDVTPSEMVQHNRLGMSRMVFPGQMLRIPPHAPPPPPPPPKPEAPLDIEVIEYQFVKVRVRHITTGRGVVGGSILFTPNAVIFDPDPSDPLVEELEPEAFQIIAPMEFVVNAAIFYDFFPIGNTKKVAGREYPPSRIFRLGETDLSTIDSLRSMKESKGSPEEARSAEEDKGSPEKARPMLPDKSLEEESPNHKRKTSSNSPRSPDENGKGSPAGGSSYSLSLESGGGGETLSPGRQGTDDQQYTMREDPYYLRLTMGKPVSREVSKSTPTMAYGLQTMMPEYWFIVPAKQILNLYRFFLTWFPEIYVPFDLEVIHEMGFELVEEPDLSSAETSTTVNSVSRIIQKTMTMNSIDLDALLPEMDTKSDLLTDDQRKILYRYLPPRVQGSNWELLFSTVKDGFSLHSLYRKAALVDSPVLIVIQDTDHAVFGALVSCAPVMSESFMGTGESWLFTFYPSFKVYEWTGENNFIVRGGHSSLVVGSSHGHFGLWLDENFNQGRSMAVATFNNKPLPGKEDFHVNNMECWIFR